MNNFLVSDLVVRFQALVDGVPTLVRPFVVALAGAIHLMGARCSRSSASSAACTPWSPLSPSRTPKMAIGRATFTVPAPRR